MVFRDAAVEWKMLYYCCFIILFQFGWACVQISHLALITQLTGSQVDTMWITFQLLIPGQFDMST
jgi:Na+/melibiose symporter-like transporter